MSSIPPTKKAHQCIWCGSTNPFHDWFWNHLVIQENDSLGTKTIKMQRQNKLMGRE